MKIYRFITCRNKSGIVGINLTTIKKNMIKENGCFCYLCGSKNFNKPELEHKIPIMLGGEIFNKSNLSICCQKSHKEKTIIDKKIIKILKDMGLLEGTFDMSSLLSISELREFYIHYYPIIQYKRNINNWDIDTKQEYEYVETNREYKNEVNKNEQL